MAIAQDIAAIRGAAYGKDVREAIAHGIEQCYTDVTNSSTLANTAANSANSAASSANSAATKANQAAQTVDDKVDEIVLVQNTQPTSERNKIWVKPESDEYKVPTWEEFQELSAKVDGDEVDPEVIKQAVQDWLGAHPEETTTVADGSITYNKLDASLKEKADTVTDLKSAFVPILDKLIKKPLKTCRASMSSMNSSPFFDKDAVYYNTDSTSSTYKKLRYYDGTNWVLSNYTVDDLPYHYNQPTTLEEVSSKLDSTYDITQDAIKSFPIKTITGVNGEPTVIRDAIGGFAPEGLDSTVHVCGKNIFPVADVEGVQYGVYYRCKDGIITINGTGSSNGVIALAPCNYFLPNGLIYTMSCNQLQSAVYMLFDNRGITTGYSRTVTLTGDRQNSPGTCGIKIEQGKTYDNLEVEFQVELGATATEFEPYVSRTDVVTTVLSDVKQNYSFEYHAYVSSVANVMDFGAKGDGVSDDTNAIQSAINLSKEIYFPDGIYIINGTITIRSGCHLFGNGDSSKIKLGNNYTLTQYMWRETLGTQTYYFYPYLITQENAKNVLVERLAIEGNTTEADVDQIQTGLCLWHATNSEIREVNIQKVNFHPESAPSRETAGQTWRRGWCLSMFYSENIIVRDGVYMYGPYECVRVGDYSKHVLVENCIIKYGWRTGLQLLKGTEYITIKNCDIEQDSHEEDDNPWCTGACMTFHAYEDAPIKHVRVLYCTMHGTIWNSDGTHDTYSVHFVDAYNYDFLFDHCIVDVPNSYCSMLAWGDKIKIDNCQFISDNFGIKFSSSVLSFPAIFTEEESGFASDNSTIKTNGMGLIVINTGKIEIKNNKITGGYNTAVMNSSVELSPSLIFIRTTQDTTHSGTIIQKSQICNNMCTFLGKRNGIHVYLDTNIKDSIICENVLIGANYPILAELGTNIAVINNICKADHAIDVPTTNNMITNNLISA